MDKLMDTFQTSNSPKMTDGEEASPGSEKHVVLPSRSVSPAGKWEQNMVQNHERSIRDSKGDMRNCCGDLRKNRTMLSKSLGASGYKSVKL